MVRKLKCLGIVLMALFFIATAASAQDRVVVYGGSTDAREHGYQHGYRDGLRQGRAETDEALGRASAPVID